MIDVTDVAGGRGRRRGRALGPATLPVDEVAARADTIPYELLTRVGARVPRVRRSRGGEIDGTDRREPS